MTEYQKIVKTKLIELEMSMNELAERTGYTRQAVWMAIAGKRTSKKLKAQINDVLGIEGEEK